MDYPAPRVKLTDGRIDLSDAYGVGVGPWDRFIVDWLYGDGDPSRQGRGQAGQDAALRHRPGRPRRGHGPACTPPSGTTAPIRSPSSPA